MSDTGGDLADCSYPFRTDKCVMCRTELFVGFLKRQSPFFNLSLKFFVELP